ncbi:GNAT family N-acetyltransferase [Spirochaeta africana]|uniref:Acetyltransferase, ribosomal protein N-acetylase n=1 Tax=Spirochaeta africana (strain ATCC 700263 / DSM 8902 / Z-7692) TaxID=889378 RepID=H9UGD9_SPIAZ|nr:GNAT family protein [Spirochaeta africana]AFG36582.1 acetyltransferase, ribosomal protein N-acetylase [Spirochaeta africana DSM 8902]
MPYFPKLRGERVYLSPIDIDDAPKYTAWLNDLEIARGLTVASKSIALANERDFLKELSKKHVYGIVDAATDTLIGNCALESIDQLNQSAEIGIVIGEPDYLGRGYGTDAMRTLVRYGFDYLNLHNIYLKVFGFNERAVRCYEKVGFRLIGRQREALLQRGTRWDLIYMDIIPSDLTRSDAAPGPSAAPSA